MTVPAADAWQQQLQAWAIPQHLLDAVEGSPYEWSPHLWKRRSAINAQTIDEAVTTGVVRSYLPDGRGTILDVGAGRGRASLPLTREGHRLHVVERDRGMLDGLDEDGAGLDFGRVEGLWPESEGSVPEVDVAMAAHVVYDVVDIAPFLEAMHRKARSAVVLELTPTHPWSNLAPYFRQLHDLERPEGPSSDDLAEVVGELFGVKPQCQRWQRFGQAWFADWPELEEHLARRLVLPRQRWDELHPLVAPQIVEVDGRLHLGDPMREMVTLWWET